MQWTPSRPTVGRTGSGWSLGAGWRRLSDMRRSRKRLVAATADALIAVLALWLAYTLRLGEPFGDLAETAHLFVFTAAATIVVFQLLGVYRWVVRSGNLGLWQRMAQAIAVVAVLLAVALFLAPAREAVNPRSLFVIFGLLLCTGTVGIRLAWQSTFSTGHRGEPVAVYGAGVAGRQLVSSLRQDERFRPVLFIDDHPKLANTTVAGLPVRAGDDPALPRHFAKRDVTRVILAMPSLGAAAYARKLERLEALGVSPLTIPPIGELQTATVDAGHVRDISLKDILGRQEVPPDPQRLARSVAHRRVLVTGGGGSIGAELCRQIVALSPERLAVVDHCEANLYHIGEELEAAVAAGDAAIEVEMILASVTDREAMDRVMAQHGIQTVYHAAAYKHVPIVERYPERGIEVNVFGTLTVLEAAAAHAVEHFVLISTDKAVRPSSAMGASKRIAELILQARAAEPSYPRVSMVRFGNVLGSSGSVVPKFRRQIEAGGPVTITDPNIERYFMTIPEAAQLVLQAGAIARGGDVFVLDMGEPVRIIDLARTMVHLSGRRLQSDTGNPADIELRVEGLRPGEKMYEELFLSDAAEPTPVPKVSTAAEAWIDWTTLEPALERLDALRHHGTADMMREALLALAFLVDLPVRDGLGRQLTDPASAQAGTRTAHA